MRVFQTLEVTKFRQHSSTSIISPFIPITSVFVRVFQTLEVKQFSASFSIKQPSWAFIKSKDIRFRARISNTRGDHFRQRKNKYIIPRTSVFVRVFQTLEVTILFSTSLFIPRTSFFVRVFQTLEVTISEAAAPRTSLFIPRTSIFVRVFQTLEVTISGSIPQVSSSQGHPFSCAYFKHSR